MFSVGGRALTGLEGLLLIESIQTPNANTPSIAVGLREMSFGVERETAQTIG
jgi:hypothetical protein